MNRQRDSGEDDQSAWLDRHLGKIVAAAFALCLLALVGRAIMG